MIKRQLFLFLALTIAFSSCVKETYNMSKLSEQVRYSPTFGMSVANGEVSLSDIVNSNDTVIIGSDKFIRLMLTKDSVVDLNVSDLYDFSDMVSYSKGYTIGDMHIADFQNTYNLSLNQITNTLGAALKSQIQLLDGTTSPFPTFPQTDMGDLPFATFPDFAYGVFSAGTLELTVKNNLPVDLNGIRIKILNSSDRSAIGDEIDMSTIAPGATRVSTISLSGKRVTNSIIAVVTQKGSPGSLTPVPIDLDSSIDLTILGSGLKVQSGRVKLPSQLVISTDAKDTVSFDPGSNIEIEKISISSANLSYSLTSLGQIRASVVLTLPSATDVNGNAVSKTINISSPNSVVSGTISMDNTTIDLSKDVSHPFNRLPISYVVSVGSSGTMIDFNSTDSINIEFSLLDPEMDYIKGYFGQISKSIATETLDLGLDEILSNISGEFHISNPSITLNYSNSFGIPIRFTLDAEGVKNRDSVNLDLDPFILSYPTTLTNREISSSFSISKNNSALPDLISLPPSILRLSGSVLMNPAGSASGRNNYIFGDSHFMGSVEVEVPLEFWINNLQFSDTLDNFLTGSNSQNNDFSPSDLDYSRLDLTVNNGFPVGLSLKMSLYDPVTRTVLKTIDASEFLTAAPVDTGGRATGSSESVTHIEFTPDFFDSVDNADQIIFTFKLKTSGTGTEDVKIYSDYKISFSAAVVVKPEINVK